MNNELNNNLENQNNGVNAPQINNTTGVNVPLNETTPINNSFESTTLNNNKQMNNIGQTPINNFNQPLNDGVNNNMNNNQNKSSVKIIIIVVLSVILLIAIGGGAFYFGQKMADNNDNTSNNNNNQTVNENNNNQTNNEVNETQNVVVNGVRYSIPTNYIYEISNDTLSIYDNTHTWAAVLKNEDLSYDTLKNAVMTNSAEGFSIRNISGAEVVYYPTTLQGAPYNLYYLNFNSGTMILGIFHESTLSSDVENAMVEVAKNATVSRDIDLPGFNFDEFYDGLDSLNS